MNGTPCLCLFVFVQHATGSHTGHHACTAHTCVAEALERDSPHKRRHRSSWCQLNARQSQRQQAAEVAREDGAAVSLANACNGCAAAAQAAHYRLVHTHLSPVPAAASACMTCRTRSALHPCSTCRRSARPPASSDTTAVACSSGGSSGGGISKAGQADKRVRWRLASCNAQMPAQRRTSQGSADMEPMVRSEESPSDDSSEGSQDCKMKKFHEITLCVKHSTVMCSIASQPSRRSGVLAAALGCCRRCCGAWVKRSAGRPTLLMAAAAMPARPNAEKVAAQPRRCSRAARELHISCQLPAGLWQLQGPAHAAAITFCSQRTSLTSGVRASPNTVPTE